METWNFSASLIKASNRIQTAKDDFFKLVNDLQHPGQSKKADQHNSAFKSFQSGFYTDTSAYAIPNLTLVSQKASDHYQLQIPTVYLTRAGQPPDQM